MSATTFGIIIATESKMVRRIVVPDDDAELLNDGHLGPGESMLIVPVGLHDLITCQALVKQATGIQPPDPSCAVVDKTNTVVAVIMADPALDTHPAGQLVSCYAPVAPGHTYDPITQLFSTPQTIIPVSLAKNKLTPTIVPPAVIPRPVQTATL